MAFGNSTAITGTFVAKDNASKTVNTLRKNIQSLGGPKFGPLGSLIGGFASMSGPALVAGAAIGAVSAFLIDGVKSAIAEEKSLARLDTALENNIEGWDGNREAIDKAIESRQDLAFEDDALRDSLIKLVAATKNETKALDLQALAMDLARGRGIDLAAATDLVLKANMGNIGALKRAGIQIDKNATSTEILAMLQKTYAGQAEAYAQTTEGAMESAQIAIGEVAEDVGAMLIPAIKDAAIFLRDTLIPAIRDTATMLGDLGTAFIDVADDAEQAGHDIGRTFFGAFGDEAKGLAHGTILDTVTDTVHNWWDNLGKPPPTSQQGWVDQWTSAGQENAAGLVSGFRAEVSGAGSEALDSYMTFLNSRIPAATGQAVTGMNMYWKTLQDLASRNAKQFADTLTDDMAGSLKGNKDVVETAMDTVMWAIKHPMAHTRAIANIEGALTTLEYKRGLAGNTDAINVVIDQQMAILRSEWSALTGMAYEKGVNAADALRRGLNTFHYTPPAIFGRPKGPNIYDPGHKGPGGRAAGGPTQAGETYLVGEEGPELLHMGGNGYVQSNRSMGGGDVYLDGEKVGKVLDRRMGRQMALAPSDAYTR